MNLEELKFSFMVMQWLIMGGIALHSWVVSRSAASAKELLELRTRIVALEEQARHLPDQAAITALMVSVESVRAELGGVQSAVVGMQRGVERINDYLLREKA